MHGQKQLIYSSNILHSAKDGKCTRASLIHSSIRPTVKETDSTDTLSRQSPEKRGLEAFLKVTGVLKSRPREKTQFSIH